MRKLFKDFIHRSGVFFVGFEKVNVGWVAGNTS